MVETRINHLKKDNIRPLRTETSSMLPNSPGEEILCDRQDSGRPSNHKFALVLGQEIRPQLNPMCCHVYNLHNMKIRTSIKNKVVSTIPYRPTNSWDANTNSSLGLFINTIQPISKHIFDISWRWDIICGKNNPPNQLSKGTWDEEMFNSLLQPTKWTLRTPLPFSFG